MKSNKTINKVAAREVWASLRGTVGTGQPESGLVMKYKAAGSRLLLRKVETQHSHEYNSRPV